MIIIDNGRKMAAGGGLIRDVCKHKPAAIVLAAVINRTTTRRFGVRRLSCVRCGVIVILSSHCFSFFYFKLHKYELSSSSLLCDVMRC